MLVIQNESVFLQIPQHWLRKIMDKLKLDILDTEVLLECSYVWMYIRALILHIQLIVRLGKCSVQYIHMSWH